MDVGRNGQRDSQGPVAYVNLVLDDEFPLSIFYISLKAKLAP